MRQVHRGWYVLLAIVALMPMGMRVVTWKRVKPVPIDDSMAREGKMLFEHEWIPNDPLAKGGDGLGPVFNANSCVFCHKQGGLGGSGGLKHNVTVFVDRRTPQVKEGVVHARGVNFQETLSQVDSSLPNIS